MYSIHILHCIKLHSIRPSYLYTFLREGSGRPPAGIIVDTQATEQEDDDEMFVKEEPEETAAIKQPVIMGGGGTGGQHGGLVQKIIDSQKQYTGAAEKQVSDVFNFPPFCELLLLYYCLLHIYINCFFTT